MNLSFLVENKTNIKKFGSRDKMMDSDPTRPGYSRLSYSSSVISGLLPALLSVRPSLGSGACAPEEGEKDTNAPTLFLPWILVPSEDLHLLVSHLSI